MRYQPRKTPSDLFLFSAIIPMFFASLLLVLLYMRYADQLWSCNLLDGVVREVLNGTTEGRQALFGSCWIAPLPTLFYLPFAWLFPHGIAYLTAFLTAWTFVFWSVREACKSAERALLRTIIAQIALLIVVLRGFSLSALQIDYTLSMGCTLLAVSSLADWFAKRRLRDLTCTAMAAVMLAWCGFSFAGIALLTALLIPFAGLGDPQNRQRFHAWILLGYLPLLYGSGVWLLMNKLILQDSLFFMRSLQSFTFTPSIIRNFILLPILVLLPALILTWWRDATQDEPTSNTGYIITTMVLISFAVVNLVYTNIFNLLDMSWATQPLFAATLVLLCIAIVRINQPFYRTVLALLLLILFTHAWLHPRAYDAPIVDNTELIEEVESHVKAQTKHGRVFALGYTGLQLLKNYQGNLMQANLDLHIASLKAAYIGQDLFILMPEPVGQIRTESIFWQYPHIYQLGTERMIYERDFEGWRLFKIISAPTQQQLDTWQMGN